MVDCRGPYWMWDQYLCVFPGSGKKLVISRLEAGLGFSVGRVWRLVAGLESVFLLVSAGTSASVMGLSPWISVWVLMLSGLALFGCAQGTLSGEVLLRFIVVSLSVARCGGLALFLASWFGSELVSGAMSLRFRVVDLVVAYCRSSVSLPLPLFGSASGFGVVRGVRVRQWFVVGLNVGVLHWLASLLIVWVQQRALQWG